MLAMQQQQLAQAFEEALRKRHLTAHGAHDRFGISRESLRKMERGQQPALPQLERWARAIGEDVNHWRQLAGYEPVINGARALIEGLDRLRRELDADFTVNTSELAAAAESPELRQRLLEQVAARLGQRAQPQGA